MNQISLAVFTLSNLERTYADQVVSWYLGQMEGAERVDYHHAAQLERGYAMKLQERLVHFIVANRADGNDTRVYSTLFDRLIAWNRAQVASQRAELRRNKPARLSYEQLEALR